MSIQSERELARWYPLIEHPVQRALIGAVSRGVRFPVVPAGRRSGKTERAKRFIVKQAMRNPGKRFFAAAPTRDQVKKIYWHDLKLLSFASTHAKAPSESDLIIRMPNDAEIHLIGLDRPERIEGILWHGGVIDELADLRHGDRAWKENILPALNTFNPSDPDYRAWCWLIGVPDGLNHYYDLAQYAETSGDPDWALFHWKSADILPADVIAAAKRQMSARQYKQEYEASFETATGRIYEDYSRANVTDGVIAEHEQLCWYHDFNYTPMSSGIGVIREPKPGAPKEVHCLDEIILTSAVARQSALEFCEKYKDHKNRRVVIYGDPAGRAGEKHGHQSDYTELEGVLRDNGFQPVRRVKPAAPAIKDRQNAVRAMIANAAGERRLFVNPAKAPYTHKGLSTVQTKEGSTFLEDETDYQHITTAVGYFIDYEFPIQRKSTSAALRGH